MFTRFAASCTNLFDPLLAYGPEADKQFIQKSRKYHIDIEDVRQSACLIFMEKIHLFDPTKGKLNAFLWAHLNKSLLRESLGPFRFALWLDDNTEAARFVRKQLEALAAEDIVLEDISESEC